MRATDADTEYPILFSPVEFDSIFPFRLFSSRSSKTHAFVYMYNSFGAKKEHQNCATSYRFRSESISSMDSAEKEISVTECTVYFNIIFVELANECVRGECALRP